MNDRQLGEGSCSSIQEVLPLYVLRELTAHERPGVMFHVENCRACQQALVHVSAIHAGLVAEFGEYGRRVQPDSAFLSRLERSHRRSRLRLAPRCWWLRLGGRAATVGAAFLVTIMVVSWPQVALAVRGVVNGPLMLIQRGDTAQVLQGASVEEASGVGARVVRATPSGVSLRLAGQQEVRLSNGSRGRLLLMRSPRGIEVRHLTVPNDPQPTWNEVWYALWETTMGAPSSASLQPLVLPSEPDAVWGTGWTADGDQATVVRWKDRHIRFFVSGKVSLQELLELIEQFSIRRPAY